MIKIFSFNGRINRGEYAISFVLHFVIYFLMNALIAKGGEYVIFVLLYIPNLWFLWAQGAKRCHDIDENGWWQIVPFYFFVLMSRPGNPFPNKYDEINPYYGADDYEKPFSIDQEINQVTVPVVAGDNEDSRSS